MVSWPFAGSRNGNACWQDHGQDESIFIQAFLFNSPFFSAPIERIADKRVKHGYESQRVCLLLGLLLLQGRTIKIINQWIHFLLLSAWIPSLFVNPGDPLCSEYIGYFEHRKNMDEIGIGAIEKLAARTSLSGLLIMSALGGKESEALHVIPSADVIINLSPYQDFRGSHGIHQWWRPDLVLQCKRYKYT